MFLVLCAALSCVQQQRQGPLSSEEGLSGVQALISFHLTLLLSCILLPPFDLSAKLVWVPVYVIIVLATHTMHLRGCTATNAWCKSFEHLVNLCAALLLTNAKRYAAVLIKCALFLQVTRLFWIWCL